MGAGKVVAVALVVALLGAPAFDWVNTIIVGDHAGIIGYVGSDEVVPVLLDGLRRLEYRGYDSAGIAVSASLNGESAPVEVRRAVGKLGNLEQLLGDAPLAGHIGIGHIVPPDKVIKGAAKTVPVVDQNLVALSSSFKGDNTHLIIPVANGKKKTKKLSMVLKF